MDNDGALRRQRPSIELYNTIYADAIGLVDSLATKKSADEWLRSIEDSLPPQRRGSGPPIQDLLDLRQHVRDAYAAALGNRELATDTLEALNRYSTLARSAPVAVGDDIDSLHREANFGPTTRSEIIIGALASDAIDLLTSEARESLKVCGAPRCVDIFIQDHPRRIWCSVTCGNRARQARHYQRIKKKT